MFNRLTSNKHHPKVYSINFSVHRLSSKITKWLWRRPSFQASCDLPLAQVRYCIYTKLYPTCGTCDILFFDQHILPERMRSGDSQRLYFFTYFPREVYPCSRPSWQLRTLSLWLGWHQSKKSGVPGWGWVLLQAVPFALSQSSNGNLPQTTWPAWGFSELCPPVWKWDLACVRSTFHIGCG